MTEKKSTKEKLLKAFDQSQKKTIVDLCRIVGINRTTFYFHFEKDADFRRRFFVKQQQHLAEKIAAV